MKTMKQMKRAALVSCLAIGGVTGMRAYHAMADTGPQSAREAPHAWCDFTSSPAGVTFSATDAPQSRVVATSTDACGTTVKQVVGVANAGPGTSQQGTKVYWVGLCGSQVPVCQPRGLSR